MSLFTCLLNIRVAGGSERDGAVGTELAVVGVDEDGNEAVSLGEDVHVVGDAAHRHSSGEPPQESQGKEEQLQLLLGAEEPLFLSHSMLK